ncbi:hypothetical protein DL93DRAFT_1800932 [Clavulina sp. PMI_390]|nr:hypothetical protein DL93DRAFT_1800932 [Clavulina sp. PMI_390]
MLDKGGACVQCRKHKVSRTETLQMRLLELEAITRNLKLSLAHELSFASTRLFERAAHLGTLPQPGRPSGQSLQPAHSCEGETTKQCYKECLSEGSKTRDGSSIDRIVEWLRSFDLAELEQLDELPLSLSVDLVTLFLPYRSQYYFMMDTSYLMSRIFLPPSHPDSLHPCLLSACYLGACACVGGELASFKPSFLQRTRRFLQHSLAFADRIDHFLWASLVLNVFYARERRLVECFVGASATTRLAIACGLDLPSELITGDSGSDRSHYLLPPPKDAEEADDWNRLAQAIYVGGRTFPLLWNCSAIIPYNSEWPPGSKLASLGHLVGKVRNVIFDSVFS